MTNNFLGGLLDDVSITDVSGVDPRKLLDLVNDLWASRQKIVETVDFVWDNREALGTAIDFVQRHADDLIELGTRLPDLLAAAGRALDQAGGGAQRASQMLLGDGGGGVRELAADAADALERCQTELWNVMGLLDQTGTGLRDLPLVGDVAEPLVAGAGKVGLVAGDLGAVAQRLRGLGAAITDAGGDLGSVGVALASSGAALQRLDPGASPRTVAARPKKPAKKSTAKKAATKKGTAAKTKSGGRRRSP